MLAQVLFLSIRALALCFKDAFMGVSQNHSLGQEALEEQGIGPCLENASVPGMCQALEEHNNICGMEDRIVRMLSCVVSSTARVLFSRCPQPDQSKFFVKMESLSRIP